ncbi:MAG: hypothetical protein N2111_06490 [Candidatus Sumerlaeaceae bacterium]|nr:hypothetical protein [Candidatus Sumerlaeaceae bacterium]
MRCRSVSIGLALFLGCASALAQAAHLTFQIAPGACVRTGTGTLVLHAHEAEAPVNWVMVSLSTGEPVATGTAVAEHGAVKVVLPLERFGVYRVHFGGGVSVDVAAIPDNRRTETCTTSPFAMGCYFGMRFSAAELEAAVRLASVSGVAASREEIRWDVAEPRRGEYCWEQFDRAVDACVRYHIGVLGLVDYWGAYHPSTGTMTNKAVEDFAAYAAACVRRYRPDGTQARERGWPAGQGVSEWEIWNEPATFWAFSAADFGRLTAAAYRAIKAADPNARVFFADASEPFNTAALAAMGGRTFDAVAPHFYMPPRSPAEGGLARQLKSQREFYERQGIRVPMWITEIGWYADRSRERQVQQAVYLAQSYVLALAAGYERIFWYNFINDTPDDSAMHYGLLTRPRLEPRLGFGAFAGLVSALDGLRFVKSLELGRFVHAYVFAAEGDDCTVAAWTERGEGRLIPSEPLAGSVADLFGNVCPGPAETVRLTSAPVFIKVAKSHLSVLESARIEGIPQVDLRLEPTTGALAVGRTLSVVAENLTRRPVVLQPRVECNGLDLSPAPVMNLDPATSAVARLRILGVRPAPDNRWDVRLTASIDGGATTERLVRVADQVATRGTPVIDGDLSDWRTARPLRLDSPDQVAGISPWMDWNLSATYWLQWDDRYLYFASLVQDNVHCQPHTGDLIWEGDSWQLAFDSEPGQLVPAGQEPGVGKYCYGLALTATGPQAAAWQGHGDASRIKVSVRNLGPSAPSSEGGSPPATLLTYECAIPADLLAPLRLKVGSVFGFCVLLNDNDGGGRLGWMESAPGIGTGFNPAVFPVFELQ